MDAAGAAFIRQALLDLAAKGAAVVVISQDLDEIMKIADRFAALNEGRLSVSVPTGGLTVEEIGLMLGGTHEMHRARIHPMDSPSVGPQRAEAEAPRDQIGAGSYHPFTVPLNKQDGSVWPVDGEVADDAAWPGSISTSRASGAISELGWRRFRPRIPRGPDPGTGNR